MQGYSYIIVIVAALIAAISYGIVNNILETRLKSFSYVGTVFLVHFVCTLLGAVVIGGHWIAGKKVEFPIGKEVILYAFGAAALYYLGSLLDVFAYTIGGRAFDISTIFIAIPVTVGVIMIFSGRGLPNSYQLSAFILVAIAIILFFKGAPATDSQALASESTEVAQ